MRRYDYFANDLMDWLWWSQPTNSGVVRGRWVDTDRFDIVPKKAHIEATLKTKQEQLESLQKEITDLKKSLSP